MSQYSAEEIAEFRRKDKRISLSGIIQALIQSGKFSQEEIKNVDMMMKLTREYSDEIWRIANDNEAVDSSKPVQQEKKVEEVRPKENYWITVAKAHDLKIPTQQECKVLGQIWEEYNNVCPEQEIENLCQEQLLQEVLAKYSAYPTKEKSISTVLNSIKLSQLFKQS